jgi:phosphate:Na+ symporter
VAYSHFLFNLVTGLVALALFRIMVYLVQETFGFANDPVLGLALFHTLFNVLGVLIFIPLIPLLAKGLMKIFPEQKNVLAQYINNTTTDVSEAAISAMQKEVEHLVDLVLKHNLAVLHIDQNLVFSHYDYLTPSRKKVRESLALQYANIKVLQAEVFTYAGKIQEQELMESEADAISRYLHCARSALHSAKTLKDIQRDLEEFENADNRFLNEQYTHFRKRLIETYLKIDKLRDNEVDDNLSTAFLMIMNALDKDDTLFIKLTSQASQRKHINEIDISTALIVNRAFVQSSRQIILAIRELKLETHEIEEIEHIQEVAEELIEDHEAS